MPMVTPTLNLPQPALASSSSAASKAATATPAPALAIPAPAPSASPLPPSATVTLSPQALNAMAAASHASSAASASADSTTPPTAEHDGSVYAALKNGISSAVSDVGDAIASGAHAVVDGVETTFSTANRVAKGIVELPFAAVSRACDAAGALIDKL